MEVNSFTALKNVCRIVSLLLSLIVCHAAVAQSISVSPTTSYNGSFTVSISGATLGCGSIQTVYPVPGYPWFYQTRICREVSIATSSYSSGSSWNFNGMASGAYTAYLVEITKYNDNGGAWSEYPETLSSASVQVVSPPSFSINNKSVSEGGTLSFTVSRSGTSSGSYSLSYMTTTGTAGSGDFVAKSGTLAFSSGQTSKSISVSTTEDTVYENTERMYVNLSSASGGATISDSQGYGDITNDDSAPSFSINNKSVSEGGTLTFTVTKSGSTAKSHNVSYATAAGTAGSGDYTSKSATLTFSSGQASKTVSVSTTEESVYENTERMYVNLSSATNGASISDSQGYGDIVNDDSNPSFTINNKSVSEGGILTFTVTKSELTAFDHNVSYATATGTAGSGDFTPTSGLLTFFSNGQTSITVNVSTTEDSNYENTERMYVNLSGATSGAIISDGQGYGDISNDDSTPSFSINNTSVSEGGTLSFTVTKSGSTALSHSVNYATGFGSAGSGDFIATSGALTFDSGQTSKTILVSTTEDSTNENTERLYVNLSGATSGATISDNQGNGDINDDDGAPSFSINNTSVSEGGTLTFTVTKSGATALSHSVSYTTGTGSAGSNDFSVASGALAFSSGESSKTISISTSEDSTYEGTERLYVDLTSATNGATISDNQGSGDIINDDSAPSFSINNVNAPEGGSLIFTVTKSGSTALSHGVNYGTATGTASSSDFTAASGSLTFSSGQTSKTVSVSTTADSLNESTETMSVVLWGPTNGASIGDGSGTGSINSVYIPTAPPLTGGSATDSYTGLTENFNGMVGGSLSVAPSGSATYTIPIQVTPGTAGVTPSLGLSYNSSAGEGTLGRGWSLSGIGGAVTRCPLTGVQDGQHHGVDYSSVDGLCFNGSRLVPVANGSGYTEYRTEIDSFVRVRGYGSSGTKPSYFRVWLQNGAIEEYGSTSDSKIEGEGSNSNQVGQWLFHSYTDVNGNQYTIEYLEESNHSDVRVSQILYGENVNLSTTNYARVLFDYENSSSNISKYLAGSRSQQLKRLNKISVQVIEEGQSGWSSATSIREYAINYNEGITTPSSGMDRLTSVQLCAPTVASNICTEKTEFEWQTENSGFTVASRSGPVAYNDALIGFYPVTDLNGDGSADFILDWSSDPEVMLALDENSNISTWNIFSEPNYGSMDFEEYTEIVRVMADMNGDGMSDYVVVDDKSHYVSLSNGTNYSNTVVWTTQMKRVADFFVDLNADGRADYLTVGGSYYTVRFSNGNSYGPEQNWSGPNLKPYYDLTDDGGDELQETALFRDMNKDGLPDLITIDSSASNYSTHNIYLNNGNGFGSGTSHNAVGTGRADGRWADMNSDGYLDYVTYSYGSQALIHYISFWTGDGYVNETWSVQNAVIDEDTVVDFQDYNGDGLPDFLMTDGNGNYYLQFNNGSGYDASVAWSGPSMVNARKAYALEGTGIPLIYFADINGDGYPDILVPQNSGGALVGINNSSPFHLVEKITDGLGSVIDINYKNTSDSEVHTKGVNTAYPQVNMSNSAQVVSSVVQPDGIGGISETTYRYEGFRFELGGRGSLGFEKIISENRDEKIRTVTEYYQNYPLTGLVKATESHILDVNNDGVLNDEQLMATSAVTYQAMAGITNLSGPPIKFACVDSQVSTQYDLDGNALSTTNIDYAPDNIEPCDNFSVNTVSVTTITDHTANGQTHSVRTTRVPIHDQVNWFIGQTDTVETKSYLGGIGDPDTDTKVQSTFDTKGRLQSIIREPDRGAPFKITTTFGYDNFGNLIDETVTPSETNLPARTESVTFDTRGRFPEAIYNALNHSSELDYDERFGTVTEIRGPNRNLGVAPTTITYDNFGRKLTEMRADFTKEEILYRKVQASATGIADRNLAKIMVETTVKDSGNTQQFAPVRTYLDGFGRTLRTRTRAFDASNFLQKDVYYDSLGRLEKSSESYFAGNIPSWNVPSYDVLGRSIGVVAADPTKNSSTEYNDFTVTTYDALLRKRELISNAVGQVLFSTEADLTAVEYGYTVNGLLGITRKVDLANNVIPNTTTSFEYDRLGRRISVNDPDVGLITYKYNSLGETTKQQTPRLRAYATTLYMEMEYDILGRLILRYDPTDDLSAFVASNFYFDNTDNGNAGIGALTSESMSGGNQPAYSRSYFYSAIEGGKLSDVNNTIANETFTVTNNYDALGRLQSMVYPETSSYNNGYQVNYSYNSRGYLERVYEGQGNGDVLYQITQVNALGQIEEEYRGDGSLTSNVFEAQNRRLLATSASRNINGTNQDIQSFEYDYDALGNMTLRSDMLRNLSETLTYDTLNRVTGSTTRQNNSVIDSNNFGFDNEELGNLTLKGDIGNLFYEGARPHAVTRLNTGSENHYFNYDDNGNLANGDAFGNGRTITWTSFDKPSLISQGSVSRQFYYGTDGSRYQQVHTSSGSTETTTYIGDLYARVDHGNGQVDHKLYVFAASEAIAVMVDDQTTSNEAEERFFHRDHLGSITAIVDSAGIEALSYDVFGNRRDASDWSGSATPTNEERGYTGHEHLDDVNLIHMNGRIYDPVMGRMASADPFVTDPLNPQNFNRYSYVLNNPLRYTDPSGYSACGTAGPDIAGFFVGMSFAVIPCFAFTPEIPPPPKIEEPSEEKGGFFTGGCDAECHAKWNKKNPYRFLSGTDFIKLSEIYSAGEAESLKSVLGWSIKQNAMWQVWFADLAQEIQSGYESALDRRASPTVHTGSINNGTAINPGVTPNVSSGAVLAGTTLPLLAPAAEGAIGGSGIISGGLAGLATAGAVIVGVAIPGNIEIGSGKGCHASVTYCSDGSLNPNRLSANLPQLNISGNVTSPGGFDPNDPENNINWKSKNRFGHAFTRHGQGVKNTKNLAGRAASTGNPQGQWLNNQEAAEYLSGFRFSGNTSIRIPQGMGQVIRGPGMTESTTYARVIWNANGTIRSAFPIPMP